MPTAEMRVPCKGVLLLLKNPVAKRVAEQGPVSPFPEGYGFCVDTI